MLKLAKDYCGSIEWNVGALFAHDKFIIDLFDVTKELGLDFPINYVFGSIPCRFQGGRIPPLDSSLKDAEDIIDKFNLRGIGVRLTFSNYFITEDTIRQEETRGIELLKHINKPDKHNGVIISNDMFAKFVKDNFKHLEIIASQVKPSIEVGLGKDAVDYYNKLFDLYDIVVVNPFKVNDPVFLRELKNHDRVEFIANHRCVPNCPMAGKHYMTQMQMCNKALDNDSDIEYTEDIINILNHCYEVKHKFPLAGNQYSTNEIDMLIQMGFNKFKIEGRDNEPQVFLNDLAQYVYNNNLFDRLQNSLTSVPVGYKGEK